MLVLKIFIESIVPKIFAKKNEKKLGIKIIAQREPYFCLGCRKIVNKKCYKKTCKNSKKKMISGTKIRNLLKKNKKIPEYLMHEVISKLLNNKSVLNH